MAAITLENVSKEFAGGHAAVRGVDLEVADGELVVLVGPSGSGKSTLLRLIAGLDLPTTGRILIDRQDVTDVAPRERDLAMVFQSYALYPHKSVRENLAFGLRMRRRSREEIDVRVAAVAGALQIENLLDRRPAQLSGGQRQRVALGRAIVREPRAFLFDEPLSNLDPALRLDTRTELALLHRRLGATMVYVTHDQEEAMKLGERVVVLREGRIEQAAPPMQIYRHPATLFVARFVGSPPMNLLDGRISGSAVLLEPLNVTLPVAASAGAHGGDRVVVGIRPEDLLPRTDGDADVELTIDVVEPTGHELHVHLRSRNEPAVRLTAILAGDVEVRAGERMRIHFRRDRLHFFPRETNR